MPNARFRTWINGDWVTITLRPHKELNWGYGGYTREGWETVAHSWILDGGTIHHSLVSDGCDCDGRLTNYRMSMARVEDITRDRDPVWLSCDESQHDYEAERAGY